LVVVVAGVVNGSLVSSVLSLLFWIWSLIFLGLYLISILIVSVFTIFQLINSSILALMQANMKIEFSLFSTVL
jgi:hypothetical protein